MPRSEEIIWTVKRDYVRKMLASGKRPDGRGFDEYRSLELEYNYIPHAEGSCLVKLGNTMVLVGVKTAIGEPYPDSQDAGVLVTNAELIPLASPAFEMGPPGEECIEIARVVDRGIRESGMIDFKKLCIKEGEKVWSVLVDVHVLDFDGNLIDAASIGAVKALLEAKFPKYEDDKIIYSEKAGPLPIVSKPVSTTFAKIGPAIIVDPTLEEEKAMDARLTIVTTPEDEVCAMQKGETGAFTQEEIESLIDKAIQKGKEVREIFNK